MSQTEPTLRRIPSNGIELRIAEMGSGPLVVMCHGFPGLWYSWRHQLKALADAGFHAVAIDQRGYGGSDRPTDPIGYDSDNQVADMVGLLDALGEEQAVFVGHDFGAAQVWNLAIRAPERVRAVVVLSCPYDFDIAGRSGPFADHETKPSVRFAQMAKEQFFHAHYFQTLGPADQELGGQPREFLTRLFWALGAEGDLLGNWASAKPTDGYLDALPPAEQPLPWPWLTEADMDYWVEQYAQAGPELAFIGGLNSYRLADRNWELGARWCEHQVECPALFIAGRQDPVLPLVGEEYAFSVMREKVPDLRGIELIDNAGHFVQQEQPEAVNRRLIDFLHHLEA